MVSIKNNADRMLTAPVSTYVLPDGIRLLSVSRTVLDRVYTLAFAFRMTNDTAFSGRAYRELAAAAAFPDWNPSHFLDVAEMTHAFAIGYDWLYEIWTPAQKKVIRDAMVTFGITAYDAAYAGNAWWLTSAYNWNFVCNGGIGMAALALADEDTARYADLVLKTVTSMVDAGSGVTRAPWLFWMSKQFNNPLFAWYQLQVASPHPLDLIWYAGSGQSPSALKLPRECFTLLEPVDATFTIMNAVPLPGSPNPTGQQTNGKKVSIQLTKSGTVTIAVLFTPGAGGIDSATIPIPSYRQNGSAAMQKIRHSRSVEDTFMLRAPLAGTIDLVPVILY